MTQDVLQVKRDGYWPAEAPHAVTLRSGQPVALRGDVGLHLRVTQHYRIIEDPELGERGPFKCSTTAYWYSLENEQESEILAYQWHPDGSSAITWPHLHIGEAGHVGWPHLREAHLPTGRVALEEVLRLAIHEFAVEPLRNDWEEVLARTKGAYEAWRTWPGAIRG